ncbi:hypothetical protein [Embleya sp. NBC_00896]|uniref:hypothetical protein n=1 Tax=Embleya sp. NBC_00896 TaxID=2975961 RepID=UPI00386D1BEB|nr:hypothetical protein OG928_12325 [Embleya sp. NBC_00896]
MRPLLKPALRRLWRDRQTLQLGLDPRRAVLLVGLDPTTTRFVEHLDGTRDLDRTYALAEQLGLDRARAASVLELLAREGVLEDASGRPTPVPTLPRERARLGPDLTSLALVHGSGEAGLTALERRARAVVAVHGAGRVGAAVAALLAAAGWVTWCRPTADRCGRATRDRWGRRGTASAPAARPPCGRPCAGWPRACGARCPRGAGRPTWR